MTHLQSNTDPARTFCGERLHLAILESGPPCPKCIAEHKRWSEQLLTPRNNRIRGRK